MGMQPPEPASGSMNVSEHRPTAPGLRRPARPHTDGRTDGRSSVPPETRGSCRPRSRAAPQGPACPTAAELRPGPGPAPSARRAGRAAPRGPGPGPPPPPPASLSVAHPLSPLPPRPPGSRSFPHRPRSLTPVPVPARRPLTVTARRGGSGNGRAAPARQEGGAPGARARRGRGELREGAWPRSAPPTGPAPFPSDRH